MLGSHLGGILGTIAVPGNGHLGVVILGVWERLERIRSGGQWFSLMLSQQACQALG